MMLHFSTVSLFFPKFIDNSSMSKKRFKNCKSKVKCLANTFIMRALIGIGFVVSSFSHPLNIAGLQYVGLAGFGSLQSISNALSI